MPSIECVCIASAGSFWSRSASRPPCTLGCSVFTRPSIISGNLVISEMSETARPASRSALAVPPVEISTTPCRARPLAKSTRPVLSETESNARRMSVMRRLAGITGLRPVLSPPPPKEKCQTDAGGQGIEDGDMEMQVLLVNHDVAGHGVHIHQDKERAERQRAEDDDDRVDDERGNPHAQMPLPTTRRTAPVNASKSASSIVNAGVR